MFFYGSWFRLACVVLLLVTIGLVFPATAQARPLGGEPPPSAEPARLVDLFWGWIADRLIPEIPGDRLVSLVGKEGWGMDPNGGKGAARGTAPLVVADSLP